ncbi:hypothetical protein [Prauserella cavernicola]|uniref:Uncharacterized protein n=1 Tax=Prauserella cavernicola TaxID=2800127 RepID=A0A934R177_9PSEU|nr:hypothetical protein [Prauserella cavernicola]MBK1789214.1 hypothetical protein [Prauserella cavernicola]
MSGGFTADNPGEAFGEFGKKLDEVADNARETRNLLRGMVADPGLFGIFLGQIMGAAASAACDDSADGFDKFGEALEKHREKLDKAAKSYEEQDQSVKDEMSEFVW